MLRSLWTLLAAATLCSGTAMAGHHSHFFGIGAYIGFGHSHYAAPVYGPPAVAWQPAYVVPGATVAVGAYPFASVAVSTPAYAPMVPVAAAYPVAPVYPVAPAYPVAPLPPVGFYRATYAVPHAYPYGYAPHEIEIRRSRHYPGVYRVELDFD